MRKIAIAAAIPALALAASAFAYAAPAASAASAPIVVTTGTIHLTKLGYYLDDRSNSSAKGAVVQVAKATGGASQVWQVMSNGTIRHNGLCLDVAGAKKTNSAKVDIWTCTGGANQVWRTIGSRITNPVSGKVLNDAGNGGPGTQQILWSNTGSANEVWAVVPTPKPVAPDTISITGVTSKQDMPAYNDPNNDFVTVADSLTFGTSTVASVRTTVDGTYWVQTTPVTYAAGSSVASSVVTETPNSTHSYTVEIISGSGAVLAASAPVSYTATLFPPVPPPVTDPLVCTGAVQFQGAGGESTEASTIDLTGDVLISVTRDGQEVSVPAGYKLSFTMPDGTVTLLSPDPLNPPTYTTPSLYLPGVTFTQVGQQVTLTSSQVLPATASFVVGAGVSFWFTGNDNLSFDDPITLNGQACQMTSVVG